jgi:hypothetical protein
MILLDYKVIIYPLINELPFLNNHKDKKTMGGLAKPSSAESRYDKPYKKKNSQAYQ